MSLLESKGTKRTVASILAAIAAAAPSIPVLAPYQVLIGQIAGLLGFLGVAHAGVNKAKKG